MATQPPKSIGEAINEFTDDDVPADETEVADETVDNTDVSEGTAEGADEEASEEESFEVEETEEGEAVDEDEEGEFPDEQPGTEEDEEAEADAEGEGEADMFDALTPEDMAVIKGSPELQKIRKLLLRGYNKKMEGKAQLLRLGEAYNQDPIGVLNAIAKSHGLSLSQPEAAPPAGEAKPDQITEAREKVEKLFGAAGPTVREALDSYWEVLNNQKLGPVQETLGRVIADGENVKMQAAETEWRARHQAVLTPTLEEEVVRLGNSGRYVPGENTSPGEYLDDLLIIAQSKHAKGATKEARRSASKKLAKRIRKNRQDREPGGVSSKANVQKVSKLESDPGSFQSLGDAIAYADEELSQEE
jgi:hypothetical protein